MKKYTVHIILAVVIIVIAVVIGCKYFNKEDSSVSSNSVATSEPVVTATSEPTVEPTAEPTEAPHEHVYTETVTTEATCETDGLKTFACECGDSYTEVITAAGHVFENYIYNEDATYLTDGTQTATCNGCELTDTQTAFGSMLKYTFTPMDATMYALQTVNVRNLPCTDGDKIGSLSTNDMVIVTGQCIETGWFEIHNDNIIIGYVSNNYLSENKVVVQQATTNTEEVYEDGKTSYSTNVTRPPMEGGDGGELIDNPNFVIGDGSGNYYDQYGNLVNP